MFSTSRSGFPRAYHISLLERKHGNYIHKFLPIHKMWYISLDQFKICLYNNYTKYKVPC
ncbi:hypothetical protein Hdeb2414_s0011g00363211 [Helianthus debilis subsp. tardiflorus]